MSAFGLFVVGAAVMATTSVLMIIHEVRVRALNVRVSKAVAGEAGPFAPVGNFTTWLSSVGRRYRRFYSPENLEQMQLLVQSSGFNPHRAMPIWIGGKTVSMALFPLVAWFYGQVSGVPLSNQMIYAAFGLVLGLMAPRWVLWSIRRRFNAAVQRGTPDTIDLLVVCVEAGMGLESGLERVAQEMSRTNPAMTNVLTGLLDDLRVLPNRRDAFENLSKRSTTDGLRRFGTMINQSLQYGTPLGSALRAIAAEIRRDRIIRLEEKAHQLGAKLTIPMVLFMLPAMFVILGGSPMLHLMRAFK